MSFRILTFIEMFTCDFETLAVSFLAMLKNKTKPSAFVGLNKDFLGAGIFTEDHV